MYKFAPILILFLWHTFSYSQTSFISENNIRWEKEFVSDKNNSLLRFTGAAYSKNNGALPIYHKNIPLRQGFKVSVQLKNAVFEKLDISLNDTEKRIYLATAHYGKFINTVNRAIPDKIYFPLELQKVLNKKEETIKLA